MASSFSIKNIHSHQKGLINIKKFTNLLGIYILVVSENKETTGYIGAVLTYFDAISEI